MLIAEGAGESAADLLPEVYNELRKIAAAQMATWHSTHTLQPTGLVHEAWLRLGGSNQASWTSHSHFVAAAAEAMRHILIDRARRRQTMRHGGGQERVDLDTIDTAAEHIEEANVDILLAVDGAIDKLALEHPKMAELVKLHCFVGLEVSEIALALGISRATATRWWQFARTWLYRELHA